MHLIQPRQLIGALRCGLSRAWRGETHRTFFDPFNPRELNPVLARHGVAPPFADPSQAERGREGAARFVMGLYATSPRLRRRFPAAFAGSEHAPFCRWLLSERRLGLSETAFGHVAGLFACNYGSRAARAWEAHRDLREELPFALTPFERGKFLDWLLGVARPRYGLADEEVLWHLWGLAGDPSCGLERTYRYTPEWQRAVPEALTDGWQELKRYVGGRMGFVSRWLRRAAPASKSLDCKAARPRSCGQAQRGVNLLGYFRYTSGLQQVALTMAEALRRAGVPTSLRDVPAPYIRDLSGRQRYDGTEAFGTSVINLPIDLRRDEAYRRAGLWPRPGVKRVAVAWWELERVPDEFAGWAGDFDEIWAPTRFIADAVRRVTDRPVRAVPPGLELTPITPRGKEHFGLDPRAFTFLFVFDFNSRMPRKNPLGLIHAFRLAFKRGEPAQLVIKASAGDRLFQEHRRQLLEAAGREGVPVIDRVMGRDELLGLTACCDCYVSLHRSEGFGLTIAEAMLLGKPAIATGYSGNVDFMTPDNSLLVDFTKAAIADDVPPYPRGFLWAEPSVEHAAEQMRWVFDHPAEARALGEHGREDLRRLLSLEAYGARLVSGLR